MANQIEAVFITNWNDTGLTVPIARYEFDIRVQWIDDTDTKRTYGPLTHVFPNALATMPADARRRWIEAALLYEVRVRLGIDTWDNFLG